MLLFQFKCHGRTVDNTHTGASSKYELDKINIPSSLHVGVFFSCHTQVNIRYIAKSVASEIVVV